MKSIRVVPGARGGSVHLIVELEREDRGYKVPPNWTPPPGWDGTVVVNELVWVWPESAFKDNWREEIR